MSDFEAAGSIAQKNRALDNAVKWVEDTIATKIQDVSRIGFKFASAPKVVSPVYSGHFAENWTISKNQPFTGVRGSRQSRLAQKKLNSPSVRNGEDMILGKPQIDDKYYITNNVPYAWNVEYGIPGVDADTGDKITPLRPYLIVDLTVERMVNEFEG